MSTLAQQIAALTDVQKTYLQQFLVFVQVKDVDVLFVRGPHCDPFRSKDPADDFTSMVLCAEKKHWPAPPSSVPEKT
jgi:FMN-dependent NADH-azoreductase